MLMLLTFPVQRVHQFADHYRTPEIRRSVARHSFLDETKSDASERISAHYLEPGSLVLVDFENDVKPFKESARVPRVPLARLLLRLKLGSSLSGTSDPLL
jgi:hypothetical protein